MTNAGSLEALLYHIDSAVDASDDILNVNVPVLRAPGFTSAVIDAALAEYAAHGWRVYHGRKAGTWLRLERDSFAGKVA